MRLVLIGIFLWTGATGVAGAQDLLNVGTRVPPGATIHVTDVRGVTVKGTLASISEDAVELRPSASRHVVRVAGVRRIRWEKRDSPWTGVLIGAAIGAAPGIYWLIADPNECTGLCPEEYALIAAGGVIGGLIDRAVTRKVTVFEAAATPGRTISLAAMLARDRKGVRLSLRF